MSDGHVKWVDKDAFVLPILPGSLKVDPQFAALLHTAAFLEISGDKAVDPDWAVEALEHMAFYLQRLTPSEYQRFKGQLERVVGYGREQEWPDGVIEFIDNFFFACGVETESD